MSMFLKQSTAITIKFGPFLDSSDGNSVEGSLTLSQADFRLSKNGGDFAQKNESSSATHDELGYYDVSLDTTDTGTLGRLKIAVHESGALPVWQDFMVVPANVWDSLFGADKLLVEVDDVDAGSLTDISDAVLGGELTQPSAVFSWSTTTLAEVLAWLGALARNKITQDSTEQTLRNEADNADLASAPISDSSGTFTRGTWV